MDKPVNVIDVMAAAQRFYDGMKTSLRAELASHPNGEAELYVGMAFFTALSLSIAELRAGFSPALVAEIERFAATVAAQREALIRRQAGGRDA